MASTLTRPPEWAREEVRLLDRWVGEDVSAAEVMAAMTRLRHRHRAAAVQTNVVTLVVVAGSNGLDLASGIVDDLGNQHPSRTLLITLADGEGPALSAEVMLKVGRRHSGPVCFDEVRLTVRGRARFHLDSVVEPFSLADLPVVVWLPDDLPSPGDPLLCMVDRVVVDSRAVSQDRPDTLRRIAALGRRLPVADLSWYRLQSWRWMLSGLFEGVGNRAFLGGVEELWVSGNYGPRTLLAGWVASRLALAPSQVHLETARHVTIRLEATSRDRRATFVVSRPSDLRCLESTIEIDDGPSLRQVVPMRHRWPALALASALTAVGPDQAYVEALEAGTSLVQPRGERV